MINNFVLVSWPSLLCFVLTETIPHKTHTYNTLFLRLISSRNLLIFSPIYTFLMFKLYHMNADSLDQA